MFLACCSAYAQSAILYDYIPANNSGTGIFNLGKNKVYAVLKTNISTGEKDGYITFITSDTGTGDGEGHIAFDEIPAVIEMLNYAQDNLVGTSPKTEKQLVFVSHDDTRFGVRFNNLANGGWFLFCIPDGYASQYTSVKASEIPKFLTFIKDSEAKIQEHISSN